MPKMNKLTIIGDVHGLHNSYLKIVAAHVATVQVGDFGFDYSCLNNIDHNFHRINGGNHDNYDIIGKVPHYLGDYGCATVNGVEFFFVRGERSVDANMRIEGRSWWRNEELEMAQCCAAIDAFAKAKPDIVITHGCPASILPLFVTNAMKYKPSRTAQLLDSMCQEHKPRLWVFGHHHVSRTLEMGVCTFRCLNELETMTIS